MLNFEIESAPPVDNNPTFILAVYDDFFNAKNYFNANGEAKLFWHYYFMIAGAHWLGNDELNKRPEYRTNSLFRASMHCFSQVKNLLYIIDDIFKLGLVKTVLFTFFLLGAVPTLTVVALALETFRILVGGIGAMWFCANHKILENTLGAQVAEDYKNKLNRSAQLFNQLSLH